MTVVAAAPQGDEAAGDGQGSEDAAGTGAEKKEMKKKKKKVKANTKMLSFGLDDEGE